jgi:hypothetical protein
MVVCSATYYKNTHVLKGIQLHADINIKKPRELTLARLQIIIYPYLPLILQILLNLRSDLPSQHPCKHQRRYDGSITFNDILRCMNIQFTPCDLFIRVCTGIRTIRSSGI